jgi:ribosome-binding protein aMBF1 (putative translation factor)
MRRIVERDHHPEQRDRNRRLESEDVPAAKKWPPEVCRAIVQARLARGMKQQDLARALNVKAPLIADIEAGRAAYDGPLLGRIKRLLGI